MRMIRIFTYEYDTNEKYGSNYGRMVRSLVAIVGGSWAGIRTGEGGEFGVGSSHSTWFKFRDLCLCGFGGGVGEMGAR